jgi:Fur family transcriptional regulator, ferric uptake regulator
VSYVTRQKQVLGGVFERAKRPLTPAEICAQARRRIPSLGIATVYRAIKQLVSEGQVRAVELPGVAPHYESAGRHHHHFFLCQQCERLFDLSGCLRGVKSLAPSGFRVQEHEIVLYGECATCIDKPLRRSRASAGA